MRRPTGPCKSHGLPWETAGRRSVPIPFLPDTVDGAAISGAAVRFPRRVFHRLPRKKAPHSYPPHGALG